MSYLVHYNSKEDIICVSVEGELNLPLLKEMATEITQEIKKYHCKYILNDLRQATLGKTCLDVYNMPKQALQAGVTYEVKRALIVNEYSSSFKFLETVFINQGNIVRLFKSTSEAKLWLLDKKYKIFPVSNEADVL